MRDAELVASAFEVIPHVIDLVPAHDALIAAMPGDAAAGLEDANVDPDTAVNAPSTARWPTSSLAFA